MHYEMATENKNMYK